MSLPMARSVSPGSSFLTRRSLPILMAGIFSMGLQADVFDTRRYSATCGTSTRHGALLGHERLGADQQVEVGDGHAKHTLRHRARASTTTRFCKGARSLSPAFLPSHSCFGHERDECSIRSVADGADSARTTDAAPLSREIPGAVGRAAE